MPGVGGGISRLVTFWDGNALECRAVGLVSSDDVGCDEMQNGEHHMSPRAMER